MKITESIIVPPIQITRNVGWSFFCLKANKDMALERHFEVKEKAQIKPDFTFPKPTSESERMDCLWMTIRDFYQLSNENAPAKISKIAPPGLRQGFCQFTGGGNLFIESQNGNALLLFTGQNEQDISLSPRSDDEICGITIEGKKRDYDTDDLIHQLFANSILTIVSSFTQHINDYSEEFLVKIEKLSGYSIAYTGSGYFGFYKLIIDFGNPMEFVKKVPLNDYLRPYAASYVDFALDYFFGKLNQTQQ